MPPLLEVAQMNRHTAVMQTLQIVTVPYGGLLVRSVEVVCNRREVVKADCHRALVDGWQVRLTERAYIKPSSACTNQPEPLARVSQRVVEVVAIYQKSDSDLACPGHKKIPPSRDSGGAGRASGEDSKR